VIANFVKDNLLKKDSVKKRKLLINFVKDNLLKKKVLKKKKLIAFSKKKNNKFLVKKKLSFIISNDIKKKYRLFKKKNNLNTSLNDSIFYEKPDRLKKKIVKFSSIPRPRDLSNYKKQSKAIFKYFKNFFFKMKALWDSGSGFN